MFFDKYPEFIESDVRKDREHLRVTSESMSKRCEAILPKELIHNKTILDLGCATGAMGHYALRNGAAYYTGVEIQDEYYKKAVRLLIKYNGYEFHELYQTIDEVKYKSQIVIACGFIHAHFDVFSILKQICDLSNKYVIIESHDPIDNNEPSIGFSSGRMVKNDGSYSVFEGLECRPNKQAIDLIMSVNGFKVDKRIYPEKIISSHDAYNTRDRNSRFICRYIKDKKIRTLEDEINGLAI
jgi:SAM-dependent methyltransferase